jgi:hypothetical protein
VVQKLGVGSTLAQAFLLPIFQFRDFLRIAAVPVLVFSVISGISYFLFSGTTFSLGMNPVIIPFFVIFFLLSGLMMIAFIVSWHRLVLLGPTETHRPFPPFFAKRDFRFLGYVFLLGNMAATLWLSIGINAFVALLCYPFCHWLLVFPGLTIDESKPLKLVGTIIDGHRPRFFAIMLIVSSAVYGAEWAVSWAFLLPQFMGSDPLPADSMARMMAKSGYPQLVSFLQWTVGLFGSAVIASALSISFRKLKEAADAGPTPPAA